ncbi:MAG: hypothetical protein MPK75_05885, partial [Alphaproteobacteria bacterium]|nr:hypothetical protein [Alphaproteobacteria bacterium]
LMVCGRGVFWLKGFIDGAAFFVLYRLIKGNLRCAPLAARSSRGRSPRRRGVRVRRRRTRRARHARPDF